MRTGAVAVAVVALVVGLAVGVRPLSPPEPSGGDVDTEGAAPTAEVPTAAASADGAVADPRRVPPGAEPARVARHVDGDTIRLVGEEAGGVLPAGEETVVRLLEIDTPEVARSGTPGECYAEEASRALEALLPVGAVVEAVPDRDLLDPYGRTLLYLWSNDGVFVNLEMVRQGYAEAVLYEPNDEYIDLMRNAEAAARSEDRGLWGAC